MSIDNAKLVLKPFFPAPSRPRYIRQIAKDCELSYERVQHYLNELEKINAVESETKGRIKEYSINRKHELILKIFSLIELDRRQEFYSRNPKLAVWLQNVKDGLTRSMKETAVTGTTDVKFGVLFGSFAREDAKTGSDIDILVAVKNGNAAFENRINELAKRMHALAGKKFSIQAVDLEELKARWKKEPFYATLWRDHIIIYGDETFWREVLELGGEPA